MTEASLAPTRRSADLRQRNAADVVDLLRNHGRMSRATLAGHTTLTHQGLASILNDLVQTGHVLEVETRGAARGRGRPALLYEYNPHRICVASVYVGLRYAEVSLCDGLGRRIADNVELTPGWDVDRVVTESTECIDRLLEQHRVDRARCRVAAVVHGAVSGPTGAASSRDMGWQEIPLAALLQQRLGAGCTVHEASRAAAVAEYREGAAAGSRRAIVFNLGPEMAATAINDGVPDTGHTGVAGLVGRCTVATPEGPQTLHDTQGSFAVKRRYNELTGDHVEWVTEVYARARAGDPTARAVLDTQIEKVAVAAMWLITIGNPDRFIFTGAIGDYDERAKSRLHAAIVAQTDEQVLRDCTIQFSALGRQAWIRGGVHAALDHQRQLDRAVALPKR